MACSRENFGCHAVPRDLSSTISGRTHLGFLPATRTAFICKHSVTAPVTNAALRNAEAWFRN